MTLLELFFPIATVTLAVACYACYRTSKPLRKKAKMEAEAERERAYKAHQDLLKAAAEKELNDKILTVVSHAIQEPDFVLYDRTRQRPRFVAFHELVYKVRSLRDQTDKIRSLEDRLFKQSNLIRDLQLQQRDIQKALAMGQPVE